jgi:carbamoyl-phosphate synthase large subunit
MMNNQVPVFIEVNARVGGGVPLGIAAGADWPRWLLARAAGIPVEIPALGSYRRNLYVSRFDDSHFITEAECEQMASHRL